MDLVTDQHTGRLRETLVWSNAGKAAMLYAFLYQTQHDQLTEWFAGVFVGALILHELGSRFMNQRQQTMDKTP